jgi:hypothetical protein
MIAELIAGLADPGVMTGSGKSLAPAGAANAITDGRLQRRSSFQAPG